MNSLVAGLLSALVATNQAAAASNLVEQTAGITVRVPDPNDPVEREFRQLMEADDDAHEEIERWKRENDAFAQHGAGVPSDEMTRRTRARLEKVTRAYEEFLKRHPNHARARVAYAGHLLDLRDEGAQFDQLTIAAKLDPQNPAIWNNLANYHGHNGPVKKAFEYYEKAISLNPHEPVYLWNFATTVFLFRKDAREYYNIEEQKVFDKALDLYNRALKLDPTNFTLATDLAKSYYGIKPLRAEDALAAWTNAFKLAPTEVDREEIHLHFARFKLNSHRFNEARAHLANVHAGTHKVIKERVARTIEEKEAAWREEHGTRNAEP